MSEIPMLPIDEKIDDLTIEEGLFTGTGALYAPFTMIDTSNDRQYKSLGVGAHAFTSWLPLFDDCYWIFILNAHLNNPLPSLIYQGLPIVNNDEFSFYFLKMKKPYRYRQLNFFDKQYPFTTMSKQRRTGKIKGVEIAEETQSRSILDFDQFPNNFIDSTTTDEIIRLSYGEQIGVNYL